MTIRVALTLFTATFLAGSAAAGIRPSFDEESCSRRSTDIIVATEGEAIDGELDVLATWKGSLAKGAKVRIPELASFEREDERLIREGFPFGEESQAHVSGERMVLFLKRVGDSWQSASFFDDEMKVSVAWVEATGVYGFVQVVNPGESVLVRVAGSEAELHERVEGILGSVELMTRTLVIQDPAQRALELARLAHADSWHDYSAAFEGLGDCGPDAIPHLLGMLADQELSHRHDDAIRAFTKAAGTEAGTHLTRFAQDELAFWKETGPSLPQGWWGGSAGLTAKDRYGRTLEIFRCLAGLAPGGCRPVVTEFRDFWRSLPQLEDPSGLTQMSEACDEVLWALDEAGKTSDVESHSTAED